ncbi:MAG TPA: glutamyl-tRNA reductase [Candidatus Ozemobacteraceae bacterium]|nr:glutamyl-tRNA reductase [Candidatus Ozemobacteraceae bacterium]
MSLLLIGISHHTAPVEIREKLAPLCTSGLPGADGRSIEAVTVFTCNRVEVYLAGDVVEGERAFQQWLTDCGCPWSELGTHFYRRVDIEALTHLLRVASGLDSLVLGENQILHQLKDSYQAAIQAGSVGKQLHGLFQKALETGKRVRAETRISENTVSVASTAVSLARQIFGHLHNCTALLIGAGEMATLVARHLHTQGIGRLIFTNRTSSRAEELARQFSGEAAPVERLAELLVQADLVITSTGSPRPILGRREFSAALERRPFRPLFAIDIAVPRDIAPDCEDLDNLYVYNIDDLQMVVDQNLDLRRIESEKAEAIVRYEAGSYQTVIEAFSAAPLIRALRQQAESLRVAEVERLLTRFPEWSAEQRDAVDQATRALLAKWLHQPILALKERSRAGREELLELARLFGLSEGVVPQIPLSLVSENREKDASAEKQTVIKDTP